LVWDEALSELIFENDTGVTSLSPEFNSVGSSTPIANARYLMMTSISASMSRLDVLKV